MGIFNSLQNVCISWMALVLLRVVLHEESGVQDFLAADVDGELHRISVVSDFSGINEPPKDSRAPRENSTVRTGDHTSIERMTTTRIRRRDIRCSWTAYVLYVSHVFLQTIART